MAFYRGSDSVFLYAFMWSLLGTSTAVIGIETDVYCLKSIKDSLQDPLNILKSWDFTNETIGFVRIFTGISCWNDRENRVLNIGLRDMGLKGKFPRGVENCRSLTSLDLSMNELQGPIPYDIATRLPYITSLDLSFNNFSGEIPSSIADCRYLNTLKLDRNQLTGHIPREIGQLDRITTFNVANMLSGHVPDFGNIALTEDSYANNQGLCGGPLARRSSHQRKFNLKFDYSFKSGFLTGYAFFATSAVLFLHPTGHSASNRGRGKENQNIRSHNFDGKEEAAQANTRP